MKDDIALVNSKIISIQDESYTGTAILIRDNRIVCVGSNRQVLKSAGSECKVIDLNGSYVYPGFVDAHCHVKGLGQSREILKLGEAKSLEELVLLVRDQANLQEENTWILGRNWDQEKWDVPDIPNRNLLDSLVMNHPVWVTRVDAHAGLANSQAIKMARLSTALINGSAKSTVSERAILTGIFVDEEMEFIKNALPLQTVEDAKRMILRAQDLLIQSGLTEVHDAGIGPIEYQAYLELLEENKLKIRIYAMQNSKFIDEFGIKKIEKGLFTSRSIKVIYDGALGSRGAALLDEYCDDPGNYGTILLKDNDLMELMRDAVQFGVQVNIHAIGDRANRKAIDALESALDGKGVLDHRTRLEHAQHVQIEDVKRIGKLNVIASVQPSHYTDDINMAKKRLGGKRLNISYLWKTFLEHGVGLVYGSDAPVSTYNPLSGIKSAILRKGLGTDDDLYAREKLSVVEGLKMMTSDAAYSRFLECDKGAVLPEMLADLTILDQDIRKIPPHMVSNVNVVGTIVDGKVVYLNDSL